MKENEKKLIHDAIEQIKKCRTNMRCFKTEEEAIRAWNHRPSPWHTGAPTENGWCLIAYTYKEDTTECYSTIRLTAGLFEKLDEDGIHVHAWKKIHPFKESEKNDLW